MGTLTLRPTPEVRKKLRTIKKAMKPKVPQQAPKKNKRPTAEERKAFTAAAEAVRAVLVEKFPNCFMPKGARKFPLKLRIHNDIIAAETGLSRKQIKMAMTDYCGGATYLKSVVEGNARLDLAGEASGTVTASEQQHAESRLARMDARRAAYLARKDAREGTASAN